MEKVTVVKVGGAIVEDSEQLAPKIGTAVCGTACTVV